MDPELLSNVQLFKNLPSSELKKIADRMSPVEIPADAIIVPYNPDRPDEESKQIFVPYERLR